MLSGKWASHSLLVTAQLPDGSQKNCSTAVEFGSSNPAVVTVSPEGIVRPVADGTAPVRWTTKLGEASVTAEVAVTVTEAANESATVLHDVMPLLSKEGVTRLSAMVPRREKADSRCPCSAPIRGEYDALTRAHVGRRINRVEPIKSLMLLKSTNATAHSGGAAIAAGSTEHAMLSAWIAQGAPRGSDELHRPISVRVWPKDRILTKGDRQPLLVTASYGDGSERDVTPLASFISADPAVAIVDPQGAVKAEGFGESVLSVTFMRRSDTLRVRIPQPLPALLAKPQPNRIDELVFQKLEQLGFLPPNSAPMKCSYAASAWRPVAFRRRTRYEFWPIPIPRSVSRRSTACSSRTLMPITGL